MASYVTYFSERFIGFYKECEYFFWWMEYSQDVC
jgi:hypothetical protein